MFRMLVKDQSKRATIPELLEHDRHYTFEVAGVLYTFPHS